MDSGMDYGLEYGLEYGLKIRFTHALCYWLPRVLVCASYFFFCSDEMDEETEANVIVISSDASSPEKVFTPTKR